MTQGTLLSMANCAAHELEKTNIRLKEVYLGIRVEVDADSEKHEIVKGSKFANLHHMLLGIKDVRSETVVVAQKEDMKTLRIGEMR